MSHPDHPFANTSDGRATLRPRPSVTDLELAALTLQRAEAATMFTTHERSAGRSSDADDLRRTLPFAILVAWFACRIAGITPTAATIHAIITDPSMSPATRRTLGLPVGEHHRDREADAARLTLSYSSVCRAMAKITSHIEAGGLRDEARARAAAFSHPVLLAAWALLPKDVRDEARGDVALDSTLVPLGGQHAEARARAIAHGDTGDRGHCEVSAGWYFTGPSGGIGSTRDRRLGFGLEGHIGATRIGNGFPPFVFATEIDRPGRVDGERQFAMVSRLGAFTARAGTLTFGRAHAPLQPETFHTPARGLGHALVFNIRTSDMGIQAAIEGAILVDGTWYCACMPPALANASGDHARGTLTDAAYAHRLAARVRYTMRQKAIGSDRARVRLYAHRPVATSARPCAYASARPVVPRGLGERYRQDIPYRTAPWNSAYVAGRNGTESLLRLVRQPLAEAAPYRGRGYGFAAIDFAFVMAAQNTRIATAIAHDRAPSEPTNGTSNSPAATPMPPIVASPEAPMRANEASEENSRDA
ncbi:hypothetical protein [Demequina maris]|uniref:hypothetical protein n=1 Tax=Demequina maris TaxID=1638982 RepID=UPI0007864122|nr:hypothetical protein [Demequina maris]